MTERWSSIPGAPGYEASSEGRVRSLSRSVPYRRRPGGWLKAIAGCVLRPFDPGKYLTVQVNGATRAVHELVLLTFKGQRPTPEHVARHCNGNSKDNREANLVWGTSAENQMDRFDHGTARVGEENYRSVLTEQQVRQIMDLRSNGAGPKAIATTIGCDVGLVKHVIYGQSWNWLTNLPRRRYSKPAARYFEPSTN